MKRYTPLKTLGILSALIGLTATLISGGYLLFLGIYFLGFSLILFLLDWLTKKVNSRKVYLALQAVISFSYILMLLLYYLNWITHNQIVFPAEFKGDGGIVFGIEGYPELQKISFWKRTIEIPTNGILITSTKAEELPNKFKFKFEDGTQMDLRDLRWNFTYETEFPCILTSYVVKHYSFEIGSPSSSNLQQRLSNLCDSINQKQIVSAYSTEYSPIVNDVEKPYLHLQSKRISELPKNINTLKIERINLTGNNFTLFPEEILNMPQLEELLIGHNPISKLPQNLEGLKNLKYLSINATPIKEFSTDLSALKSLETIGLDHNGFQNIPEPILTIPNLKRLRVNDNRLSDLKFIDNRLNGLESIYLYGNEITQIGCEISNLKNLKELLISDNRIDSIPDCIGSLKNLEKLEIWSNPVKYVSPEIQKLSKLKIMRMEKENLTMAQMEDIRAWLPNTKIYFQ